MWCRKSTIAESLSAQALAEPEPGLLCLGGEHDALTCDLVRDELQSRIAHGPPTVGIDLDDMTLLSGEAVRLLEDCLRDADETGRELMSGRPQMQPRQWSSGVVLSAGT